MATRDDVAVVSDGDQLNDGFFNDLIIHRKQFSDATERSTTSTSFVDSGTSFTLTTSDNALILNGFLKCALRAGNNSTVSQISLEFSGTTLTTQYAVSTASIRSSGGTIEGYCVGLNTTESPLFSWSESVGNVYSPNLYFSFPIPLQLTDTSTTIKVRLKSSSGTNVDVKDVTLDIIYVDGYVED